MASHLNLVGTQHHADASLEGSPEAAARVEAALRTFDGRVPPSGSALHAAVCEQVRTMRGRGALPGPLLIEMNRMVTTVIGYSASAQARDVGLDALLEQVVRWSLDEYYRAD